jgi:hypothetical protein
VPADQSPHRDARPAPYVTLPSRRKSNGRLDNRRAPSHNKVVFVSKPPMLNRIECTRVTGVGRCDYALSPGCLSALISPSHMVTTSRRAITRRSGPVEDLGHADGARRRLGEARSLIEPAAGRVGEQCDPSPRSRRRPRRRGRPPSCLAGPLSPALRSWASARIRVAGASSQRPAGPPIPAGIPAAARPRPAPPSRLRLADVHEPSDAELVGAHAELVAPHLLLQRDHDLP